jgi:plasmid stability protein
LRTIDIIDSILAMAQLIVRNIEAEVVRQLKRNAAEHGRSAEEEHREILRQALCPKHSPVPDFKTLLAGIPHGEDIFSREPDLGRSIDL